MSVFLCRRKGHSEWEVFQAPIIRYADAAADYARGLVERDPELMRAFLDEDAIIEIKRGGSRCIREITLSVRLDPVFFLRSERVVPR